MSESQESLLLKFRQAVEGTPFAEDHEFSRQGGLCLPSSHKFLEEIGLWANAVNGVFMNYQEASDLLWGVRSVINMLFANGEIECAIKIVEIIKSRVQELTPLPKQIPPIPDYYDGK